MSYKSHSSRRTRGLSPKYNPLSEVGRRKVVLENLQPKHRRSLSDSSKFINTFYSYNFQDDIFWYFSSTSSSTSSQASSSSIIGVFIVITTWFNPQQILLRLLKILVYSNLKKMQPLHHGMYLHH
jgi:hypothetical protein